MAIAREVRNLHPRLDVLDAVKIRPRASTYRKPVSKEVHLTLSAIRELAALPMPQTADELGISQTALKKACRKLGMPRWPTAPRSQRGSVNSPLPILTLGSSRPEEDQNYCSAHSELEASPLVLDSDSNLAGIQRGVGLKSIVDEDEYVHVSMDFAAEIVSDLKANYASAYQSGQCSADRNVWDSWEDLVGETSSGEKEDMFAADAAGLWEAHDIMLLCASELL